MRSWKLVMMTAALASVAGCKTGTTDSGVNSTPPPPTATSSGSPAGTTTGTTAATTAGTPSGSGGGGAPSIPTLINVNLQNVLNNLSVSLQVNRNSIPVTAQVPIDVAAAVCGVSVDALAASFANGHGTCTATTTTPQLNQIVQQQISTGGDVKGGNQTLNTGSGGG
jgi:hypothetical protein